MTHTVDLRKPNKKPAKRVLASPPPKTEGILAVKEKKVLAPPPIEAGPEETKPTEDESPATDIPTDTTDQATFEWEAPSFERNPHKGYLATAVISLIAGSVAVMFFGGDMLLAILLLLAAPVLVLFATQKPEILKIQINHGGILVNEKTFHFEELKSFWLEYLPNGPKELSLETKKWYMPYVKIPIHDKDPVKIRSAMIFSVREKIHEQSLIDFLGKKIGL